MYSGVHDASEMYGQPLGASHQAIVVVKLSAIGFAADPSESAIAAVKNCTAAAYDVTMTDVQRDVSRCDYTTWNVSTSCANCKAHTLVAAHGNCTALCGSVQGGLQCKNAWVARGIGCAQGAATQCDADVDGSRGHICQCRAPPDADTVITLEMLVATEELGEFMVRAR